MNSRKRIQIIFFAIALLVICDSNAQKIGYDYDTGSFGAKSVGVLGNGGRVVPVQSSPFQSTTNRNNDYQYSEQLNRERPKNQLTGLGTRLNQPGNEGTPNGVYVASRPSQPVSHDYTSNSRVGFQNENAMNRQSTTQKVQSGGIASNTYNALSRPSQNLDQKTTLNTNGQTNEDIQSSGLHNNRQSSQESLRPSISVNNNNNLNSGKFDQGPTHQSLDNGVNQHLQQSIHRNSVSTSNNNNMNGISGFQSIGQASQREPVQQDSSETLYPSNSNSYKRQQPLDRNNNYNNNQNSESNFQSNEQTNQGQATNQFNPSGNGYTTSIGQRVTTHSPQLGHDDENNNNNYHQKSDQWNPNPTKNKGGGSSFGIIASNDGYVQARPSQSLDRNSNTHTNSQSNQKRESSNVQLNNSFRDVPSSRPSQSVNRFSDKNSSNNYQSNFQSGQSRPIADQVEGTHHNSGQDIENQFFDSEHFEDSNESKPAHKINKKNNKNNINANSKNKENSNENGNNNSNINGSNNYNGSGNKNKNDIESEEKHLNSKNKHFQTSAGHQGNKITKKPSATAFTNRNKSKNTNSNGNGNDLEKTSNNEGKPKKRVSQIKYEQYLTSIFPDLDNEDVQEVKDFHGRKLARPGQFPHMGAIGFKNHILNKTEYKCGASLISDIWAITTAHCTKYNGLTPTYVRFGDLNLKAGEENVDPQTRKISLIVNHPSYNDDSLYNDIALLQLDKLVIFTEFVQPIRIWYRDEIPFTMAYAMGFGAVQFAGAQTNRLTQLDLTIVPNDICARQMPKESNAKEGIIDSQICAIDTKKTESDTFQGDSGGPLEISFFGEEGGRPRQYLIGITSFGVVGTTRLPGVYTRVSSYVDWIEKTVWSSEYNGQF